MVEPLLRLGISACLLGEEVRYDGGHARARHVEVLGEHVEWVPVCPEVEIGLGTPRPTIRLEHRDGVRLVEPSSGRDLSAAMDTFGGAWPASAGVLHGFIAKRGSPSCGPNVKVYHDGMPGSTAPGRFIAHVQAAGIPVIDEGHFHAPALRDHFLERAVACRAWSERDSLQVFHAAHKMQLLAHDPDGYGALGRLAAAGNEDAYAARFFEALAVPATRGRQVNAIQHLLGFLKTELTPEDKASIAETVDAYRAGHVPLIVPLTLLRYLLETHDAPEWARTQTYLRPYPGEWMVRAHV